MHTGKAEREGGVRGTHNACVQPSKCVPVSFSLCMHMLVLQQATQRSPKDQPALRLVNVPLVDHVNVHHDIRLACGVVHVLVALARASYQRRIVSAPPPGVPSPVFLAERARGHSLCAHGRVARVDRRVCTGRFAPKLCGCAAVPTLHQPPGAGRSDYPREWAAGVRSVECKAAGG